MLADPIHQFAVYFDRDTMVFGFGGTKNNWRDWLNNTHPEREAMELMPTIKYWLDIYRPTKVICAGHSQGGFHAQVVAKLLGDRASAVTFGGLPGPGVATHYLMRKDPMAWLPMRRLGKVVKLGPPGFSLKSHDPAVYFQSLQGV